MAKVEIVVQPSGLLNGRDWPAVGETIDIPDAVAEAMESAGHVKVVKSKVEKRPANQSKVEKRG